MDEQSRFPPIPGAGGRRIEFDAVVGNSDSDSDGSDDCDCDGKVTNLTLRYIGPEPSVAVEIVQKKDGVLVFQGSVAQNGEFSFFGADDKGTLGTEIRVFVDGTLNAEIHTSCSQPIGPGLVFGDFIVVAGASLNGGAFCPVVH